jgi:hypothetical protein
MRQLIELLINAAQKWQAAPFLMTTPMRPLARCAAISSPATAAALAQLAQSLPVGECITEASLAEFTIFWIVRCTAQLNFSQACLFTPPSFMAVAHRTSDGEASEVIGVIGVICDNGINRKYRTIVLSTYTKRQILADEVEATAEIYTI